MLILALDTTGEQGGLGIFRDEDPLAVATNPGPTNYYSVTLFQMLDRVLGDARVSLREIDLYAVANGPGSFTGIRVGVAATQGWASAFGRPVKAASVLEAMVEAAQPKGSCAVPILDARRGEFFLGVFQKVSEGEKSRFRLLGEERVLKSNDLPAFLIDLERRRVSQGPVECLVREHDGTALALRAQAGEGLSWQIVPGVLVGPLARLAYRAAGAGDLQTPAEVDASYVRRSDAEQKFAASHGESPN